MTIAIYRHPNQNGNQRTTPNRVSNTTSDLLVCPVTTLEFANFVGVDSDDPMLQGLLDSACEAFIEYTNNALVEREYVLQFDRYPQVQESFGGLAALVGEAYPWIEIPLYPLIEVVSLLIDGEIIDETNYTVNTRSKPARIFPPTTLPSSGAIKIVYRAGYELQSDFSNVPAIIKTGIMMYAAFLYEHRGACNVSDVVKDSGAQALWNKYRMLISGL